MQQGSRASLPGWSHLAVTTLVTTAVLAGAVEWDYYRKLFHWQHLDLAFLDRVILFWTLWSKSLLVCLPFLLTAGGFARTGRFRFAEAMVVVALVVLSAWIWLDIRLRQITGQHLLDYLHYLRDESPLEFAGTLGSTPLTIIGSLLVITVSIVALAQAVRWANAHFEHSAVCLVLVLSAGLLPARWLARRPEVLDRLVEALPVPLPLVGPRGETGDYGRFRVAFEERANDVYRRSWPDVHAIPPADPQAVLTMSDKPHVVIVILESFRYDSISDKHMPRLARLARSGTVFERHYAGGNVSHMGLFGLLYSRSPLLYDETLDRGVEPQACVSFRNSGYTSSFWTSGTTKWARMEEFLRTPYFDQVNVDQAGSWPKRDRRVLEHIRNELAQTSMPRFVTAFLMSTHLGYEYPPEYECHTPVMPSVDWGDLTRLRPGDFVGYRAMLTNRYRNSLAFMDDLLADWLASVDLSRTIVVITGDHGESLFDDGTLGHSTRASEIQTRVPLVIVGPGVPASKVAHPTRHADLLPTLLGVLESSAVPISRGHGVDPFHASSPAEYAAVTPLHVRQPRHLVLLDGERRLKVGVRTDRPQVELLGFLDDSGLPDFHVVADPKDTGHWAELFKREIARIVGAPSTRPMRIELAN